MMNQPLRGRVAVVAGATRGAGRGIAVELGAFGATVYVTGRSTRSAASSMGRPETIDETAEQVTAAGGTGVAVRVDHTVAEQVEALFRRVATEQEGQLDVVVNDIWGGDPLTNWDVPFWRHDLADGLAMQRLGVATHLITSHFAAPLLVARRSGLIVEVTDGVGNEYRGNLYYDLAKTSVIRLAFAQAHDLRPYGVAAVAVTPGFLRSEAMLEHFGVTEATWEDGARIDPNFIASETPHFVGRAVAHLAADPDVMAKSGQAIASWDAAEEYGFTDVDGSRPDWGAWFRDHIQPEPAADPVEAEQSLQMTSR